jgi:aerobic carbon-monoxide dehydrogenase small subunit
MRITLTINEQPYEVLIRSDEYLVETLRKIGFVSVKKGCDETSCGVCTILLDQKPIPSCSYLSARAEGHKITTVEGIFIEAEKFARFMGEEGADQCGFCNPGLALAVYAMKLEGIGTSKEAIIHYLNGNLCRCTGYIAQHVAIKKYLEVK